MRVLSVGRRFGALFFPLSLFLFVFISSSSHAAGPIDGAKASGMGTAFTAVADDPSAMAVNPAGLTQIKGIEVYGGSAVLVPSTGFTSSSGQKEDTKFQAFFPPTLYISAAPGVRDLRLGLGVFSAYGIGGRKWDPAGLTRYISVKGQLATIEINPTVAYRLTPALSIGVGADYLLSRSEAEKMVDQSAFGAPDGTLRMKGFGDGWGYNLGVLFKPIDKLSLGIAYRSRISVNQTGHIHLENIAPALQSAFGGQQFSTGISEPVTYPDDLTIGLAYRPDGRLALALDFERVGWSSFGQAVIDLEQQVPQAGFNNIVLPLDWKDVWWIKLGADYKVSDLLSLRAGYAYIPSPVPDETLDPSNPDSDENNFSLGAGIHKGATTVDLFYMADFYEERSVNNSILSGNYTNFVNFAGFDVGRKF